MSAKTSPSLLPRLRFPEYESEPVWECPPLKDLATPVTQRNTQGQELRPLTNTAEHGVVDQREFFDKDIATATDNHFVVELGDYVYNPRASSAAPVGPISKNAVGTGVMSPLYTVFRFRSEANDYFAHYFESPHWHAYLRRASSSGARPDRMVITNDDFMGMPIPMPKPPEQQKIADCFGSLDDLITAESRKLETLRQYKQGLMQQLFPRPGETKPRLRFSEFRKAGEWEEKRLEQIAPLQRGFDLLSGEIEAGDVPVVYSNGIRAYHSTGMATGPGLVMGHSGTTGNLHYVVGGDYWPHNTTLWVTSFCGNYPKFVYFLYEAIGLERFVSGFGVPKLNRNDVHAYKTSVPSSLEEQERIAEGLSSLDAQITAEFERLAALKTHKKGLMQQMFPNPEAR